MTGLARLVLGLSVVSGLLGGCATDSIEDRRFGQQVVCHDGEKTLAAAIAEFKKSWA